MLASNRPRRYALTNRDAGVRSETTASDDRTRRCSTGYRDARVARTIVTAFDAGATAEEIAQQYASVDFASIYAVISYVLDHRREVDEYVMRRHEIATEVRGEIEEGFLPPASAHGSWLGGRRRARREVPGRRGLQQQPRPRAEKKKNCAYERVRAGQPMPGVIAVSQALPVGQVIEDLLLVVQCSRAEDWTNQVRYLPLR